MVNILIVYFNKHIGHLRIQLVINKRGNGIINENEGTEERKHTKEERT